MTSQLSPTGAEPTPPRAPVDGLPDVRLRVRREAAPERRRTLLRNAHLVDVRAGSVRPNVDVLLEGGRVQRVGSNIAAEGADVVDVAGRYVLPALISLHVHPGMMVGLRMDPNGLSPERVERDLRVWLRYGVTTVQAMGSDRPFTWELQRRQRDGAILGARLFSVGHGFGVRNGVPGFQMDPPGPVRLDDPREIRKVVQELAAAGASGVKIWYDDWYGQFPKMAPQTALAIIEAAREYGLTSYAHVYRIDDAKLLIRAGLQVLAHMPRDREVDEELLALMRERGTAVIPTLTVPESNVIFVDRPSWVDDPFFWRFLPPGSREYLRDERVLQAIRAKPEFPELRPDLERAARNVGLMYRAGVRFGFGTDTGVSNRVPGFYEHRELELLVLAGVSPADALRMATLASADILGQAGALGEVAPGCLADLVVLRADPLADIRNTRSIEAVWFEGVQVCGSLEETA